MVIYTLKHLHGPLPRRSRHVRGHVRVIGQWLQAPPDTLLRHHAGRFLIGELAMLDDLHARADRHLHGSRMLGVDGHVGAPVLGRLDRSPQLRLRVLGQLDRVVGR